MSMKNVIFWVVVLTLSNFHLIAQEDKLHKELKDKFTIKYNSEDPSDYMSYAALEYAAKEVFNLENKVFLAEAKKVYNDTQTDSAIITNLSTSVIENFLNDDFDKLSCPVMTVSKEGMDYYIQAVCTEMKTIKEQRKSNKSDKNDITHAIANVTKNESQLAEIKRLFRVSHEYIDTEELAKCFASKLIVGCQEVRNLMRETLIQDLVYEAKLRNNIHINEMMNNISSGMQHKTIDHLNFNFSDKKVFLEFKENVNNMQKEIDELIASTENSFYAHKSANTITQTFMLQPNSNKPQIKFQIIYQVIEKLGETLITHTEFKKSKDIKNQKELIRRFKANK